MIDIKGLDKAKVVMALYDAARGEDRGLTEKMVQEKLDDGQTYFATLGNKVLRIHVDGDELDPYEYDQANGVVRNEKLRNGRPVGGARKALENAELIEEGDDDDATPDGSRKLTAPPKGQGVSLPPVAIKKVEDEEDDEDDEEDKDVEGDDEATKAAKLERRDTKRALRQQQRARRREARNQQEREDRKTDPA